MKGRARKKLKRQLFMLRQQVAEYIEDDSPLEALPAYRAFRDELVNTLDQLARNAAPS